MHRQTSVSHTMHLPFVVDQMLLTLERFVAMTVTGCDGAVEAAGLVGFHVALQLILTVEESSGHADAAL